MSTAHNTARKITLRNLGIAAIALWALLIGQSLVQPSPQSSHAKLGALVLPKFASQPADIHKIRFTLADESYTLARAARGWVVEKAGGYPVRPDKLATLVSGLETLTFGPKRTSDPYKAERIGLGDPSEGGNGVLLETFGQNEQLSETLILGRKEEALYIRAPGNSQTYRAGGQLPAFYSQRAWLDLDILQIEPSAISSVRIIDSDGEELYIRRPSGTDARSFRPAPPFSSDRLVSVLAASSVALAATRIAPLDVQSKASLQTSPLATHISETFDGLEIEVAAYREPDGTWITLHAVEAGRGARRAETINRKTSGWAFRLSEYDWQDFTPKVSSLVERK